MLYFWSKMLVASAKSNLGCAGLRADGFMLGSLSDHVWKGLGSAGHCQNDLSVVFRKFLWDFGVSIFVAGAVFRDVGGWLLLLRALYWTLHMWQGSTMRVIVRGTLNIWWCRRVTPVARRIANDLSYVTRIHHDVRFVAGAQVHFLVKFNCQFPWQVHYWVQFNWHFQG